MPRAVWKDAVLAESESTVEIDGKHYFPRASVRMEYLDESSTRSECPSKGTAVYYHVHVGDHVNADAAWAYPEPKAASENVHNHIAFWKGIEIETEE
jgi:uncharacterized protein (DUF427 family)